MNRYIKGSDTSITTEPCHMPCPDLISDLITSEQRSNSLSKVQELRGNLKRAKEKSEKEDLKAMKRKNYLTRLSIKANQLPNRVMRNTNENL
ncbi:hypothetical protein [Aliivibrio logei]|uniref:hypothetical protein n=1 Tax=Aliivibrio logei TaxID=688 RepID=UPI0035C8DDB0